MRFEFIPASKQNSEEVVLFFSGFASEAEHFRHLCPSELFDVIVFYDYEEICFSCDILKKLKNYKKAIIIGFSMGVAVASRMDFSGVLQTHEMRLAIAGSTLGIDKIYGIHPRIFARSIDSFDKDEFVKLIGAPNLKLHRNNHKNELKYLYNFCQAKPVLNKTWQSAIGADDDAVFPINALKNSFDKSLKIIKSKHFVFDKFKSWDELCKA